MLAQQRHRRVEIAFFLTPLFDGAHPEGALLVIGPGDGLDDRQGQLALSEIIARVLAHGPGGTAVVQQVINDLETHAERITVARKRLDLRLGRSSHHAAHFGGRLEQGGGLAPDHLRVDRGIGAKVLRGCQLQHFTFGNGGRRVGQDVQDTQRSAFHHQLEGPGKQVIAHQHGGFVVPQEVRRGPAAPLLAFVDNIVVQKRGGVNEFDRCRELLMIGARVAAKPCRCQGHQGADALAARLDQMCRYLGNPGRVFGRHARADQRVDRLHVIGKVIAQADMGLGRGVSKTHAGGYPSLDKRASWAYLPIP